MSDFFGGILDSLRTASSDVGTFFDDALSVVGLSGSDVMKAAGTTLKDSSFGKSSGGVAGPTSSMPDSNVSTLLNGAKYQAGKSDALTSVDPKEIEANWIRRLQAFSQGNI